MEFVSEKYLQSSVKIKVEVGGETITGSGFIYTTSNKSEYDYVFTAKHTLMCHPDDDQLYLNQISHVDIFEYDSKIDEFKLFESIKGTKIENKLIEFDADLVLFKIKKSKANNRKRILVTDDGINDCVSYAMTKANPLTLVRLDLERKVKIQKRYVLPNWEDSTYLVGCSGAAILARDKPLLQGFIMLHPTKEFSGKFVDAVKINFEAINNILSSKNLEPLQIENGSKINRIVGDSIVVDLAEAVINDVKLDLIKATERVKIDCEDDWFHDPLSFVDLRNTDFLFSYFQPYFLEKNYKTEKAETFFLPKSSFTLRKSLLLSYTDRLFYTALVDVLGEGIESSLLPVVYSSRYNYLSNGCLIISGVEQWKKMMYQIQTYSKEYNYVIEIDILNFYDNIDINLLCDKLLTICNSINDRNAVKELRTVLHSFSDQSESGIPQNNDASSLLATFYLNEIDTYMIHQVPKYLRFMDDIKIFCQDEFEARRYLSLIEMKLRELKLSLNSQKTKIINLKPDDQKSKNEIFEDYQNFFNLERSKLSRLSSSDSFINRNEAFHLAIKLILKHLEEDSIGEGKNERALFQALRILKNGKIRGVSFEKYRGEIGDVLEQLPELLKERPWITSQIVYLIAIVEIELIPGSTWKEIIEIVTSEKYNTYPWQCYHLWLLLAKHKIKDPKLSKYASKFLDSNDDLNRPVIAALMIYMGSIDDKYRRIVLNKFKKGFTNGDFQKRAALITLRSFLTEDVFIGDSQDSAMHESLHKHKDKELIFVNGESDEDYSELIQMYSL